MRACIKRVASTVQIVRNVHTRSIASPPMAALRPIVAMRPFPQWHQDVQYNHTNNTDAIPSTETISSHIQHQGLSNEPSVSEVESEPQAQSEFRFIACAAWHPKNRRRHNSSKNVPYWKQHKVGKVDAGEDAFFQTYTSNGMAIGVADGVGGWADVGVDPALFSWTLMNNAASVAKDATDADAHHILDTAFHQLQAGGKVQAGSSTACILNLCKVTGNMTTCNLGDSAFLLIRNDKILYESPSQQHYFNCPYQLTVVPDTYPNRELLVTDMPNDADQQSFSLQDGDIIVLGTDGYFDNVYSHETLAILKGMNIQTDGDEEDTVALVRSLAKMLTDTARRLSLDPKRISPWAKEARALGSNYQGGKVDDITCIVTLVRGKKTQDPQEQLLDQT